MSVLLVAFYSSNSNQRMIEVVSGLGAQTAGTIAAAIQEMEGWDARMAELGVDQELTSEPDTSDPGPPPRLSSVERDPDLEREAELIQANREIKQLTSKIAVLTTDLEASRTRISTLEEELVESNLMLDRGIRKQSDNEDLERFRSEALRDRQHIAELEGELADEKALVANQERQLERLKADADTKQDLRDELQLVTSERDELSQKAKANENLHKKIRAMNEAARASDATRQDLQLAREELDELRPFRERCNALEKVNKENLKTIENGEQSLFEEKSRRTRVEHENQVLSKQLDQARDLQARAEDLKKELEEKVRELESTNHGGRGGSLEDELNVDDTTEIGEETPKAMADSIVTSDTIMLLQKVEILTNRVKSIERQYLEMLQENLGLKSDLKHGVENEESERYEHCFGLVSVFL
jgi:protein HOOK3